MRDEIARTVSERVLRMYKEFHEVLWTIKDNCDEDEFEYFRGAFAEVMGTIALDILNVVYREHPHLRPPELKPPQGQAPE